MSFAGSVQTAPVRAARVALALALAPIGSGVAADIAPRIFAPPPLAWDSAMTSSRAALHQTMSEFVALTGGVRFGMLPQEVNALLPEPLPDLNWSGMPLASEYPADVRYFWTRLEAVGGLGAGLGHCTGEGSYLVFLFTSNGLFRLSYRLLPDQKCPDPGEAARDILARYVPLGTNVAYSDRYRATGVAVVDVTDATAGPLIPVRWRQRAN